MARQPRENPRRRLDQLAREAERVLQERRDAVLPTPADLDEASVVRRSDVDRAVDLWNLANAGTEVVGLLDGLAREDERDG